MSHYDYKMSQEIGAQDYPFYALIMACFRQADTYNHEKLRRAFPRTWAEFQERYNTPGGLSVEELKEMVIEELPETIMGMPVKVTEARPNPLGILVLGPLMTTITEGNKMKILVIDPGETTGYAMFELAQGGHLPPALVLLQAWEEEVPSIEEYTQPFLRLLWREHPDLVIIEDYRVFQSSARMHIGRRLFTSELIGGFVALCSCIHAGRQPPLINTVRIQPSKKGKWPDARIAAKFPEAQSVAGHALDAVKLGLAYLEGAKLWSPKRSTEESE